MRDEELIKQWKMTRSPVALEELRRSCRPVMQSQVNKYRANMVPQAVLEAKADQILVESMKSYQPGRGTSFKTHLFTNLRRLNRFSTARSNIGTIPEARAQKLGIYQRVYEELSETKRRPPTEIELADELNWPISEIRNIQRSSRKDIITSSLKSPARMDTTDARMARLMNDIWYELSFDEQKVFAHLMGMQGKRKLSKGGDIARATGFSQAKVSQLRKSIGRKMERHL